MKYFLKAYSHSIPLIIEIFVTCLLNFVRKTTHTENNSWDYSVSNMVLTDVDVSLWENF